MSAWAKPGVKCVLVDVAGGINRCPFSRAGDICEILETRMFGDVLAVRAREINGRWVHRWDEWARVSRFRPIVSKTIEDDVAKFKHLLNTTPASEDA